MRLKAKFFLWMAALVTAVVLAGGAGTLTWQRRLISQEINREHAGLINRLARLCNESLYQNDLVLLNFMRTMESERGYLSSCFVDATGTIRIHSNPGLVGQRINSPQEETAIHAPEVFTQIYSDSSGRRIRDVAAPVFYAGGRVGTARLFLSEDAIETFMRRLRAQTLIRIGMIMGGALLLGFVGALALARSLVSPIQEIIKGMAQVSQGRLEPIPFSKRTDELGGLGREINDTVAKLKELDDLKRNFFSQITHELRSPLIAATGLLRQVLEGFYGPLPARQLDPLLIIQNNNNRLARLIDDLLTTARLEAHQEEVNFHQVDLADCVLEVQKLYLSLTLEKGLELKTFLSPDLPAAWADRDKVLHVLMNLLSNAIKYTKKGSVTLRAERAAAGVRVTVSDTGAGIPDTEKPFVFDRFFRGRSNVKRGKGTGLGLFIVKTLVDIQKASISLSDAPGGGSTFAVVFLQFNPAAQTDIQRSLAR